MTRKKALSQARTRRRLYPTAVRMVVILHDDLLHQRVVALACTQYVFELALFEPGDGRGRDHAAVGHDANAANGEVL